DYLEGGLRPGELVIVGARPSQGKSSLSMSIARNAAVEYSARVALFSLEMSREAVVERLLSAEADVDTRRLRLSLYNEEEERRLMDAVGKLAEAPIYVDDTPQLKMVELRSKARRLHQEIGVDLIILDYIGLVQSDGRRENRVQELGLISRSLKALARELDVPVLAISQLSRASEWRSSHRPQLSDLRESGDLEQDADVVLFIYREEAHTTEEEWEKQNPTKPYPKGIAEILIAKHRNGPTGSVHLSFVPRTAKFVDLQSSGSRRQGNETLPGFSS
ncbi:MAG: DnaB-like helicase C-terminal domain-containing protein, partial [Chloroflexota bacterium]